MSEEKLGIGGTVIAWTVGLGIAAIIIVLLNWIPYLLWNKFLVPQFGWKPVSFWTMFFIILCINIARKIVFGVNTSSKD